MNKSNLNDNNMSKNAKIVKITEIIDGSKFLFAFHEDFTNLNFLRHQEDFHSELGTFENGAQEYNVNIGDVSKSDIAWFLFCILQ